MHRIDGPGATIDNRFTDGDPVGGIPATMVTDEWANDVQEELMSVLAAGGVAPVKGTQDQLLKAIRAILGGVTGSSRNVKMSITAASSSATLTADQLYVSTSLSGQSFRLTSFSKSVNLATTGAGGMDVGTAPVSGYVSVYAIYNPTTAVSALLACAQATSNGSVYSGANMPAGYTASALVSSLATNASSQFKVSTTLDRTVIIPSINGYSSSGGTIPSPVPISLVAVLPTNAKYFSGIMSANSTLATTVGISVSADAANSGYQNVNGGPLQQLAAPFRCPVTTPQTAYITASAGGGTPTYIINISAYEF